MELKHGCHCLVVHILPLQAINRITTYRTPFTFDVVVCGWCDASGRRAVVEVPSYWQRNIGGISGRGWCWMIWDRCHMSYPTSHCTNFNRTWVAQATHLRCDDAEGLIMVCYYIVSSLLSDLIANVVPLLLTEDTTNALFVLRSASRFYCWLWKSVRASTFHWNVQFMAWLTLAIRPIFACLWVFGGCWYCDVIDRGDDAYPCFWFSIWTKTLYNKQWLMFWGSWY